MTAASLLARLSAQAQGSLPNKARTFTKDWTMRFDQILLEHGGGGLLSHELITEIFLPILKNPYLEPLGDGAVFNIGESRFCLTTDSYVVQPIFFPGGDIGSLAVHGTVNDLAMCGGEPLFLSAAFVLEEGFPMNSLQRIVQSMAEAARNASVGIVTGDTKVVPRGAADGLFITTSGIGLIRYVKSLSVKSICAGDMVLLNGPIGDHGAAILAQREDLGLTTPVLSDSAPLNGLVQKILEASDQVHCMRDATRGGLGAILAEIAQQAGLEIILNERDVPIREAVRGICEILGIDPLFLANEGKMVVFCAPEDHDKVLRSMQEHPLGKETVTIGQVREGKRGRLILNTVIGGSREVDLPIGELVPRIC